MGSKLQRNIEYSVFNRGILNTFESTCEVKINKYLLSGKFVVNFLKFSPPPSALSDLMFSIMFKLTKNVTRTTPLGRFFPCDVTFTAHASVRRFFNIDRELLGFIKMGKPGKHKKDR